MTEGCVFCGIVAGRTEASVAYEDDATLAFMDLRPFNAGHTLVVPKKHVVDIYELDDSTGAALIASVARVARAVRDSVQPHGLNLWQSNGAPWQEVFHLHIHILPRWRDDALLRFAPKRVERAPRAELEAQAGAIRVALAADRGRAG